MNADPRVYCLTSRRHWLEHISATEQAMRAIRDVEQQSRVDGVLHNVNHVPELPDVG